MQQQATLTHLVAENYHYSLPRIQPITEYMFEDRGIYRVEFDDGQSYVLRAFRDDVEAELKGQVAVLDYLRHQGLTVPQVLRTKSGTALASDGNWTALMISFIEGELADFAPQTLTRIGNYLGRLHNINDLKLERDKVSLPESRLHPAQITMEALTQFEALAQQLPPVLQTFHREALATIKRMKEATDHLPSAILHGDCWSRNAVINKAGEIVLIDWDGCGQGPAILDLGYLLLTCHLDRPQLPVMQPDVQRINAVLQGYMQQRSVTSIELASLEDAIFYDSARRTVLDRLLMEITEESLSERLILQKMLVRQAVSTEIARLAREYLEQVVLKDA